MNHPYLNPNMASENHLRVFLETLPIKQNAQYKLSTLELQFVEYSEKRGLLIYKAKEFDQLLIPLCPEAKVSLRGGSYYVSNLKLRPPNKD